MDEHTFRRIAVDAVTGRLDDATYKEWRAFAQRDPEREAFVVRLTAAEARMSNRTEVVRATTIRDAPAKVPKRVFWMLAPFAALVGALAGGLLMYSFLTTQDSIAQSSDAGNHPDIADNSADDDNQVGDASEPASNGSGDRPGPGPEPDDPTPPPEDPPEDIPPGPTPIITELHLVHHTGNVFVRGDHDSEWRALGINQPIRAGDTVASRQGGLTLESSGVHMRGEGDTTLELRDGEIHFRDGRVAVRVDQPHEFSCYRSKWSIETGAFVIQPRQLGGDLYVIEGTVRIDGEDAPIAAPSRVKVDSTHRRKQLTGVEFRELEEELLGARETLLIWDCESAETTPPVGTLISPGALGEGHAVRTADHQLGIGVEPGTTVFTGVEGARLRMRVRSDASPIRVEARLHLIGGYRVVDLYVDVPRNGEWVLIDVPLSDFRAGRHRTEQGWQPGHNYSAFTIFASVDPDKPLTRRNLAIDDLHIYVPR